MSQTYPTNYLDFNFNYYTGDDSFTSNIFSLTNGLIDDVETQFGEIDAKSQKFTEWYQKYQSDLARGDGNAAVDDIVQAYKDGIITKDQALMLAGEVQQQANANGGGRINDGERSKLKEALGIDYDPIAPGKTRGQMFFEGLFGGIADFFSSL